MAQKNIPCVDCLCLGACKNKDTIYCSILYNFMEENVSYEDVYGNMIAGEHVWDQVNEYFQRVDENIELCSDKFSHNPTYNILRKNYRKDFR